MKYITIKEGLTINAHEIEAIEEVDEMESKVYTHHREYTSTLSRETILTLIMQPDKEEKDEEKLKNNANAFLERAGTFAG